MIQRPTPDGRDSVYLALFWDSLAAPEPSLENNEALQSISLVCTETWEPVFHQAELAACINKGYGGRGAVATVEPKASLGYTAETMGRATARARDIPLETSRGSVNLNVWALPPLLIETTAEAPGPES